jgi:hypothetical protein
MKVIPPRPRPGRKPATDTPPTKRKAQNRAAQRAFRERRAARVGELEEQLKETEEERLKREGEMHDQIQEQNAEITRLLEDVQRLTRERASFQHRCIELERKYETERRTKEDALLEVSYLRNGARSTGTDAVPLPPRRRQQPKTTIPEPTGCGNCTTNSCMCVEATVSLASSGCGNCTDLSHCQCLEETLKIPMLVDATLQQVKRPRSVSPGLSDLKRPRVSIEQPDSSEIDFTARFAVKTVSSQERIFQEQNSMSRTIVEDCGFCADGTYCVCAAEAAAMNTPDNQDNRLAPILNLSEVTPPPSENDVTVSETNNYKLPLLHPNHRTHHALPPPPPNRMEPGTCPNCIEDPKSGLICRSLAAMRASNPSDENSNIIQPTLSCQDAYKTLASHKNFDKATNELGSWLPKLHAYPGRSPGSALDIEAASVLGVLKIFDVRFAKN